MDKHAHHHHTMGSTSQPSSPVTTPSTLMEALLTTVMSHGLHHNSSGPGSEPFHDHSNHPHHTTVPSIDSDHSGHPPGIQHASAAEHMLMYFHSGVDTTILFKDWNTSSAQGLFGSVVVIFLMAMMYEGIKFFREYMFKRYFTSLEYSSVSVLGDDGKTVTEVHKVARNRMFSVPHTIQTVLHVVQMVLSYFLMLIFMTYNVWLCLGVVLGAGTGYFLFGWKKATVVDITEHCH